MAHILNSLPKQTSGSQHLRAPSPATSSFPQSGLLFCTSRVPSSRVYLKGSTLVGLQAFPNYTVWCAAKKPVLETVKPPSATLFPELEQVPRYSRTPRAAQTNKGALCSHRTACKICSEYCLPSYCKSRHKHRFSSSAAFPLPFFKLMQFLIFNEHCCYCNNCISPIHTALSPQTEVVFAMRNCSTVLGFHLWIYPLLKATKGTCTERTFFKQMKGKQEEK